jgi:alpha-beta hydrolase superfamily lysophospholipase
VKSVRAAAALSAVLLITWGARAAEPPPAMSAIPAAIELPAPTGPHKVGTTTWRVTDPARPETFAAAGVPRQVEVLAWYPAAPGRGGPAPYLREGLAELPPRLRTALGSLANVRTHAVLDAAPVAGPKKLPVLVFSHGFGGIPSSYTALLEDLASHGYAVLSIVHPYEATAATLADGQVVALFDEAGKPRQAFSDVIAEWSREDETMAAVTRAPNEAEQLRLLRGYLAGLHGTQATLERWAADTKLVLDRLAALPRTSAAGRLAARLDLGRLGAFSHSMGGVVAGEFCLADRRCRAGLNLDGIPQSGTMIDRRLARPFLMVYSARPGRTGASDAIYRRAASRYYRCDVRDTLHLDFSDMVLWDGPLRQSGALGTLAPARAVEVTRTIVRQYFDQELLGRRSPLLAGKVTLPEVTVKRSGRQP